jgi:hypothetical protein
MFLCCLNLVGACGHIISACLDGFTAFILETYILFCIPLRAEGKGLACNLPLLAHHASSPGVTVFVIAPLSKVAAALSLPKYTSSG